MRYGIVCLYGYSWLGFIGHIISQVLIEPHESVVRAKVTTEGGTAGKVLETLQVGSQTYLKSLEQGGLTGSVISDDNCQIAIETDGLVLESLEVDYINFFNSHILECFAVACRALNSTDTV